MTIYREKLVDRMIAIYGFENPVVIDFCRLCEDWGNTEWNDKALTLLVEAHESMNNESSPVIFKTVFHGRKRKN